MGGKRRGSRKTNASNGGQLQSNCFDEAVQGCCWSLRMDQQRHRVLQHHNSGGPVANMLSRVLGLTCGHRATPRSRQRCNVAAFGVPLVKESQQVSFPYRKMAKYSLLVICELSFGIDWFDRATSAGSCTATLFGALMLLGLFDSLALKIG